MKWWSFSTPRLLWLNSRAGHAYAKAKRCMRCRGNRVFAIIYILHVQERFCLHSPSAAEQVNIQQKCNSCKCDGVLLCRPLGKAPAGQDPG